MTPIIRYHRLRNFLPNPKIHRGGLTWRDWLWWREWSDLHTGRRIRVCGIFVWLKP